MSKLHTDDMVAFFIVGCFVIGCGVIMVGVLFFVIEIDGSYDASVKSLAVRIVDICMVVVLVVFAITIIHNRKFRDKFKVFGLYADVNN